MTVTLGSNQNKIELNRACITRLVKSLARQERVSCGEVSLAFVDDPYIRELGGRYLGLRRATDVLAFPLAGVEGPGGEEAGPSPGGHRPAHGGGRDCARGGREAVRRDRRPRDDDLLGEVYVSADRAIANARRYRVGLSQEVARLIVHGVLHILGYRDDTPSSRRTMIRRQEAFLRHHRALASSVAVRRKSRRG